MTTTYTPALRLTQPGVGDVATQNAWGGLLNTDMALLESAITGVSTIDTAGASTLTLTTANGATDQARPLVLYFIDSTESTTACTVTIPALVRYGLAINTTSHAITLTTGSGLTLTLPASVGGSTAIGPNGHVFYKCDGTNVSTALNGWSNFKILTPGSGTFPLPATVCRAKLWGGGGGGGNGFGYGGGGGGGGGGYVEAIVIGAQSTTMTYTVAASAASVSTGGTTQLNGAGVNLIAGGGFNGTSSTGNGYAAGGAGGTNTVSGVVQGQSRPGCYGGNGFTSISGTTLQLAQGGSGGNSFMSAGPVGQVYGFGAVPTINGAIDTSLPGAGGSGGIGNGTGGYGSQGQMVLEW